MVTQQSDQKITYTTMPAGQAQAFNARYDEALAAVLSQLGRTYPAIVDGGERVAAQHTFEDRSPNDSRVVLGHFQECGADEAAAAVIAARRAFPGWSHTPWRDRIRILRRAADLFRERKYEIGAWLTLEVGKPRVESMGEVEEAADLISAYCDYMEEHNGFTLRLEQLTPQEVNHSVLRPYGVWVEIAPFNFPVALATGMLAGALVAGNTVVFKPSIEAPLSGFNVFGCLQDAGIPAGVLNYVTGSGNKIGEALSRHPDVDGIVFTGSRAVGTQIFREFSHARPRPCIAEMGGKNPVIVTNNADLDKAVEGTARAAYGYSGQKCSAASRLYVQDDTAEEMLRRLVERTRELKVGDPRFADTFMGPVINKNAYQRFQDTCAQAREDGEILVGGHVIADGDLQFGYYCEPTIARLPPDHSFFYDELFVPFLAVTTVRSLDEALQLANDSEYGLTAGLFSEDPAEIAQFKDRMEAGVIYVNRKGGATTGAWPKVQSFGGWKASGSTGKSALGPYYVQQFLHEQTQTVVSN